MELPGGFQEHVYMILTKFGNNFGRKSSEMTEKEEQRMTTPSTMRQVGTHWRKQNTAALARWRGWAQPFGQTTQLSDYTIHEQETEDVIS